MAGTPRGGTAGGSAPPASDPAESRGKGAERARWSIVGCRTECPPPASAWSSRGPFALLETMDGGTLEVVQALKARVHNGRLLLDEPTDLPEGTVVPLRIGDDDDMDEGERARLHAALRRSVAQAQAGQLIDADEVIGKLLARG
jgi:hypothetical protein